ncbi:MAG: DNA-binding protein [Candidatus Bathyarchaeia archaeon]
MSGVDDAELEEIKRRRYLELQQRLLEERGKEQAAQQARLQKEAALRQILSPAARQRLANLRIVRPEYVAQLEAELIRAVQTGRVPVPVSDEQLRMILARLQSRTREIKITRR